MVQWMHFFLYNQEIFQRNSTKNFWSTIFKPKRNNYIHKFQEDDFSLLMYGKLNFFYSWTVNVSCLPRLFSNLFGGLISKIHNNPSIIIADMNEVTKIPDQIGAVVNPTQSYASPNFNDPSIDGWTCRMCNWQWIDRVRKSTKDFIPERPVTLS